MCCRSFIYAVAAFQGKVRAVLRDQTQQRSDHLEVGWKRTHWARQLFLVVVYALVLAYTAFCVFLLLIYGEWSCPRWQLSCVLYGLEACCNARLSDA